MPKNIEQIEDLIASLALAREKAEAADEAALSDTLSKNIARLRRDVKKATKVST